MSRSQCASHTPPFPAPLSDQCSAEAAGSQSTLHLAPSLHLSAGSNEQQKLAREPGGTPDSTPGSEKRSVTKLRRSRSVLWLWGVYAVSTTVAWTITCILTVRPITIDQYGAPGMSGYDLYGGTQNFIARYIQNQNWYRAARVIQSITVLLTLPLTSAICASAAVVFTQKLPGSSPSLTLRQTMVLADARWLDPKLYWRLLGKNNWRMLGSRFLLVAILLNVLGGTIGPLQEILITTITIKTPTSFTRGPQIFDLTKFGRELDGSKADPFAATAMARSALHAARLCEPQAQYWEAPSRPGSLPGCNLAWNCPPALTFGRSFRPFMSQVPYNYSTGLLQQFAPRFNITTTYDANSSGDWLGCTSQPGALIFDYHNMSTSSQGAEGWGLKACMGSEWKTSPWKATKDRQDFFEMLYLNVTLASGALPEIQTQYHRVTMSTTAAYFELPNIMNGQMPGGILPDASLLHNEFVDDLERWQAAHRPQKTVTSSTATDRGPLVMIAVSLFGPRSFLDVHATQSGTFNQSTVPSSQFQPVNEPCIDIVPMTNLLLRPDSRGNLANSTADCIKDSQPVSDAVPKFVQLFTIQPAQNDTYFSSSNNGPDATYLSGGATQGPNQADLLASVFTAAGYHALQALLASQPMAFHAPIYYDHGADSAVPAIPRWGMGLVSALLLLDLGALLALALYAARHPRWTATLDGFALLRLGASVADHVPLRAGAGPRDLPALDALPGVVADAAGENEDVARLGLGGERPLTTDAVFECYEGDGGAATPRRRWLVRKKTV